MEPTACGTTPASWPEMSPIAQSVLDHARQAYVDGAWTNVLEPRQLDVVNPATETAFATVTLAGAADVERAVAAARRAFAGFSQTTRDERLGLLRRILAIYQHRAEDMAQALSREMGAPIAFARSDQAAMGTIHLRQTMEALEAFEFQVAAGTTRVVREPIGVCVLITPWNWPVNQIATKVAPALAAGCTMILKPSEVAPLSAVIWAEIMDEAGVPAGVFNMLQGDGPGTGEWLASHPEVDCVSFTGSTRAGIRVAELAARTVKRVAQELGGKSPNIILPDAALDHAVSRGIARVFENSGQSCNAPTRMLVHESQYEQALEIARREAQRYVPGDPADEETELGPVVNTVQFGRIQTLIQAGLDGGAQLVAGGVGRPAHLEKGYYVRPTIFGHVDRSMTIARDEIFGPVLVVMSYRSVEEAIEIANDTPYGLAAYIQTGSQSEARAIARRLRAGVVRINDSAYDPAAPFGGYKQSGNGREYGAYGLAEFLEVKAIVGFGDEPATEPAA